MKEPFMEPLLRKLRIKEIIRFIPKNSIVCDIGCGYNAKFLFNIKEKIKKGYGFDQKLESYGIDNIELRKMRLNQKVPLQNNSADCVTMLAVLEHLSNPDEILREIKRILKKGGELILTTPSPYAKPVLEFLSYKLGIVNKKEIKDHKHYYSKDEIKMLCKKYNLKIKKIEYFECMMNILVVAEK